MRKNFARGTYIRKRICAATMLRSTGVWSDSRVEIYESLQIDQGLGKKNSKKTLTNYGCHERIFCLLLYHFLIEGRICLKSIRLDNNRLDFNRFTLHSYCFIPSLPFSWKLLIHIDLIRSNLVYVNRLRVERDWSINTVLKNQIPSKFPEWMWTYNRR